jgi:hypothetical protein
VSVKRVSGGVYQCGWCHMVVSKDATICPRCQQSLVGVDYGSEFHCGWCHGVVPKDATICPHCQTPIGGIKCPRCGFIGKVADFEDNRCSACGKSLPARPAQLLPLACPGCGTPLPSYRIPANKRQALWGGWTCAKCGTEMDRHGRVIHEAAADGSQPAPKRAQPAPKTHPARKSPVAYTLASFFLPGLGTILCGKKGRGLLILGLSAAALIGGPDLVAALNLAPAWGEWSIYVAILLWIWGMIDAHRAAQQWNRGHSAPQSSEATGALGHSKP